MKQRFTVNIENINNIENISLEISNFTIFTGNDNINKTTMMNIIYGIFELSDELIFTKNICENEFYISCRQWVMKFLNNKISFIDNEVGNMFCELFNIYLNLNKENFIKKIFSLL